VLGCAGASVRLMPRLVGCENTRCNNKCYFVISLIFLFTLFISGQTSFGKLL